MPGGHKVQTLARQMAKVMLAVVFATVSCAQPDQDTAHQAPFTILRKLPHPPLHFTQGLFFASDTLYESTGAPAGRQSKVVAMSAADAKVFAEQTIPGIFAEGLDRLGEDMRLLTWRDGLVFRLSSPELTPIEQIPYPRQGWGLCTNQSEWFASNGSDTIFVLDHNFTLHYQFAVTNLNGQPLRYLNELEFARGTIWANVWHDHHIYIIDISRARVQRRIDCSLLFKDQGIALSDERVLNGIAWDPHTDEFYVTGKDWPFIYVLKIP